MMATLARRLITADEFLDFEFDTEIRFELDNGIVYAMAGGLAEHARIQGNVQAVLTLKLRGSGCGAYGPDMGVRTHAMSLRYPDLSVFCGRQGKENDKLKAFDDPVVVVEVLSPGTRNRDINNKLPEYRATSSIMAIVYIDPEDQSLHYETRDSARGWVVETCRQGDSVTLPVGSVDLSWDEVFAR